MLRLITIVAAFAAASVLVLPASASAPPVGKLPKGPITTVRAPKRTLVALALYAGTVIAGSDIQPERKSQEGWEAWHFGYELNAGSRSVGFGGDGGGSGGLPAFVPAGIEPMIASAAQRWNVSGALLAAQLYAESNFNPFAQSGAGAEGIAQFMPGTARSYGLPTRSIPPARSTPRGT